jgi:quercetin dioxygenase-like cupin family protein
MKTIGLAAIFIVIVSNLSLAQDSARYTQNGSVIPVRNTGNNILIELLHADSIFTFNIAVASFAATKRLDWHYHPGGQILIITEGTGYYQERGKPKQVVQKGEVIKCLPGIEHWHGAAAETGVSYMATYSSLRGATVWQEKVTDEQYYAKNK